MEKLIFTYCTLIIFLLIAILGLLLWNEENLPAKSAKMKANLISICVSIIGGLILHLNWLILPWARAQKGDLIASFNFAVVTVTFALLILCALQSTFATKAKNTN